MEKIAVGLDIGTTKIVAIVGKRNEFGKIEIIGMGKAPSLGVQRGVVTNIVQTVDSIQRAVDLAELDAQLTINSVVVGIAGQHIRSLQHSDYITRDDIASLTKEAADISGIPFITDVDKDENEFESETKLLEVYQGISTPDGEFELFLDAHAPRPAYVATDNAERDLTPAMAAEASLHD
jgi:hypothetical protein